MCTLIKQRDKEIFLNLLSGAVSGKTDFSVPDDTDFKALYLVSCAHKVTCAVYFALKDYSSVDEMQKAVCSRFKTYCNSIRKSLVLQEYYTELVCSLCREKRIKFALLKGAVIKNLYPDAAMRSSCDVDILIDKNRIDEIIGELVKNGFSYHEEHDGEEAKHAKLEKDGVVLELHRMLCLEGAFGGHYDDAFSVMESKDGVEYGFCPEELYVYNLAHASHHFMKGVNTMRVICDTYLINKTYENMDKSRVSQLLEKTGLTAFEKGMSNLTGAVFGTVKIEGELERVLDYVIMNPVRADTPLSELQREKVSGKSSFSRKLTVVFRRMFPTYEFICRRYPNAKKTKLSYPFYIVKRFVDASRQGRVKQQVYAAGRISNDDINTLDAVRRYVGL